MKQITKISVLLLCHLFLFSSRNLQAQYDYLPGGLELEEAIPILALDVSGIAASLFIKTPKPELLIKKKDLRNRSFDMAQIQSFSTPILVYRGAFRKPHFGLVRSIDDTHIVLETTEDSISISLNGIKQISDLEGAALVAKKTRKKLGLMFGGLALGSLYASITENHILELDSSVLSWLSFAAFSGIATYSFVLKSPAEKEYDTWKNDYNVYSLRQNTYQPEMKISIVPLSKGLDSFTLGGRFSLSF